LNTYFLLTFRLLLKKVVRGKPLFPRDPLNNPWEVYGNEEEGKYQKALLPCKEITLLNRINIFRNYEILKVFKEIYRDKAHIELETTRDVIIPFAILDEVGEKQTKVEVNFRNRSQFLELKYNNRFHYLPLKSTEEFNSLSFKATDTTFLVGKPLYRKSTSSKKKSRLVIQIFMDAFTQSLIEKFGYDIIPNTRDYFLKKGTFYKNVYAQSEWTLSSVAGIFTGKYTNEHLIYHPRREDKIKDKTLAEVLSEQGYMTFACTNVPKLSPINGFDKGFDRYVLAVEENFSFIINQALDQLETFQENQYLFLGFFDLHEAHTLQPILSQSLNDLEDFQYKKLKGNSKDTSILYDEERIKMYKNSATYLDKKLLALYQKIDEVDPEAIVAFHSDHGVNFMSKTTELLGCEREKVIFLYRGSEALEKEDNRIKEVRSLSGMICHDLGLNRIPLLQNSGYAITESLFPGKKYEVAIRDEKYVLFFKVSWHDIKKYTRENYKYEARFFNVNDETIEVVDIENEQQMISLAKEHYRNLIQNLKKEEGIV
tara:strand:- start:581 stop:2203 length:1623 start_codon:yes stop_codon:yes gene_type:complete